DLVVVNRRPGVTYPYAGSWVLRGVGDGRLRNDAPYDEYNWRLILGAADLDGDGDIDLPFQHEFVPGMGIGINNGSGGFTWHYGVVPFPTSTLVTVDVDGDGDVDLCNGLRLFLNAGTLQFVEVTATHLPPPGGFAEPPVLATGDFDGDGDVDLLLGNRSGQDRLYLNDGTGRFIDATATHLPAQSGATRGLAVGDLDGDGDLDIVRARLGAEPAAYRNDGAGRMSSWTLSSSAIYDATAVALADIDGDGDL